MISNWNELSQTELNSIRFRNPISIVEFNKSNSRRNIVQQDLALTVLIGLDVLDHFKRGRLLWNLVLAIMIWKKISNTNLNILTLILTFKSFFFVEISPSLRPSKFFLMKIQNKKSDLYMYIFVHMIIGQREDNWGYVWVKKIRVLSVTARAGNLAHTCWYRISPFERSNDWQWGNKVSHFVLLSYNSMNRHTIAAPYQRHHSWNKPFTIWWIRKKKL